MKKLQTAAALVALLLTQHGAVAAEVSKEFSGVWVATQNNQESLNCKKTDWGTSDNNGLINIAKANVEYWERACDVVSFRILKSQKESAEVVLACRGEGYTWRTREIWSLQTVEARRALIRVQLQASEQRVDVEQGDEAKNPSTKMQNDIYSSLYLECK
jgi:hypothetical protein